MRAGRAKLLIRTKHILVMNQVHTGTLEQIVKGIILLAQLRNQPVNIACNGNAAADFQSASFREIARKTKLIFSVKRAGSERRVMNMADADCVDTHEAVTGKKLCRDTRSVHVNYAQDVLAEFVAGLTAIREVCAKLLG